MARNYCPGNESLKKCTMEIVKVTINLGAYISEENEMLEAGIEMCLFLEADNLLKM